MSPSGNGDIGRLVRIESGDFAGEIGYLLEYGDEWCKVRTDSPYPKCFATSPKCLVLVRRVVTYEPVE